MAKELTEEQKLRRKERAAARKAKKKEEKAKEEAKKAARKKRAEERRRQKRAEKEEEKRLFDRTEQRLKNTYIGKNINNTDLELINYPFYTTSYNHEVKIDVRDDDIIKAVKLTRM